MEISKLDGALVMRILERGNDVWIKRTKTGITVLEVGVTKRQEIRSADGLEPASKSVQNACHGQ